MFIKASPNQSRYTRNGEQRCRGHFLLVFSSADDQYQVDDKRFDNLWACARMTTLTQCGHWMMGCAHALNHKFLLSGGFGNDGLPLDYRAWRPEPNGSYDISDTNIKELKTRALTCIPPELATIYWTGGGHNEVGTGAQEIRAWALKNFKTLTTLK